MGTNKIIHPKKSKRLHEIVNDYADKYYKKDIPFKNRPVCPLWIAYLSIHIVTHCNLP